MIDSCTSSGVERKTAMYAPEMPRTKRFLLRRIIASSSAGITGQRHRHNRQQQRILKAA